MSHVKVYDLYITYFKTEPCCEKTGHQGFRPGPIQTGLFNHRRWLEACNFGIRKKSDYTIQVVKTKALISCAVTSQLICVFVAADLRLCFRICKKPVFS